MKSHLKVTQLNTHTPEQTQLEYISGNWVGASQIPSKHPHTKKHKTDFTELTL